MMPYERTVERSRERNCWQACSREIPEADEGISVSTQTGLSLKDLDNDWAKSQDEIGYFS